jgi:hypothetical protein
VSNRDVERSDPDSANEVSIRQRHLDTHPANYTTGASANHHTTIITTLMAANY